MKEGRSKERKTYEKPTYEAEEILEKMSLQCAAKNPPCKASYGVGGCSNPNQVAS